MSDVQQTISALDTLFTDSLQKARLDTLSSLLADKQENMKRLVLALEHNSAPQIYQHQISLLVKSQDTVIQKPHITRQIIQKDKSYTVKEPKKNFFQRLASAFHKPEADTTSVKQTVQILETDTIHQEFNARDTLAHILDSIESSMKLYNSRRRQRINAQAERLWYTSLELNNRVTQLLESIEKEEQQRLEEESRKAYLVRKQAALTTGLIATAAILLAIVFFVIVWRDITKSNHYRRELEKAKKRAEDLLVSREKLMLTVTHDIKAPVGSIMGYTELLVPHVRENRPKTTWTTSAAHPNICSASSVHCWITISWKPIKWICIRSASIRTNCFIPLPKVSYLWRKRRDWSCNVRPLPKPDGPIPAMPSAFGRLWTTC